jgi:hypothetical protein
MSQVPVAHNCNPSYSGGRDQEDHSSKPAQANSFGDPISQRNPSQKRASGVAQVIEFLPSKHEALSSTLPPQKNPYLYTNKLCLLFLVIVRTQLVVKD